MNWDDYANFGPDEFRCQCGCKAVEMDPDFIAALQRIRDEAGPMKISSGYRCPKHPIEAKKRRGPGAHSTGQAADILVSGSRALNLLRVALTHDEIQGVGVNQRGAHTGKFIHLDTVTEKFPRPAIWTY